MGKIIIEIVGGLGNQMFQYAFFLRMRKVYGKKNVYIYLGRFSETDDNKGFQIPFFFEAPEIQEYTGDVSVLLDCNLDFLSRVKRKILGRKTSFVLEQIDGILDVDIYSLDPNKDYYLRGLWQTESYFLDVKEEVKKAFSFKNVNLEKYNAILADKCNVGMHVRRGDYISNEKYKKILGNVCNEKYYQEAINMLDMNQRYNLLVFSDDINWVKNNFKFLNEYNVEFISGNTDEEDLYLMSKCHHNIIANSTFSWWGAYLNSSINKQVIAPSKWFHSDIGGPEIIPKTWIKV